MTTDHTAVRIAAPEGIAAPALRDQFGRSIEYLRISVTDRCNFRCVYCMPLEGLDWLPLAIFLQLMLDDITVTVHETERQILLLQ